MANLAIKASALEERAKIKFQSVAPNKFKLVVDDSHEIVIDGNDVYVERINKYPNTIGECCNILNTEETYLGIGGHKGKLLQRFQRLLICRDAYWKLAGEEMGLGKPWRPDWNKSNPKYTITNLEDKLVKNFALTQNYILAFPTEEMRDAFYENFKDLIEQCKELL